MTEDKISLQTEISIEANNILNWWRTYTPDSAQGGFYGEIDQDNRFVPDALKGGILNGRILWAFSSAYNNLGNTKDLELAHRAFRYIKTHFIDSIQGGSYWALNADGSVQSDRKQIYSIAFILYGLAEYSKASGDADALSLAIDLFQCIEKYSRDPVQGGYFEAYSRDWKLLPDLRLSEKDRNDPKTMNTHLHIIEAYTSLYKVWKDPGLKVALIQLLEVFDRFIIDKKSHHLKLFFDTNWQHTSSAISYGHDIEASWLLYESACILDDENQKIYWRKKAIFITLAAIEGLQPDGSFIHEYDPETKDRLDYREWWVSAEGMVGMLNTYLLTQETKYLDYTLRLWDFIKTHLVDSVNGEWHWGVNSDYTKMDQYKIGFWKCPYHNLRACLEVLKRLEMMKNI